MSDNQRDPWWFIVIGIVVLPIAFLVGAWCYQHDVLQYL